MPKSSARGIPCRLFALAFVLLVFSGTARAQIVAFGASNVSGWNVAASQSFSVQLQSMLRTKGYGVRVLNAGVYGNTTSDMRDRMDSDIPAGTKIVVLDMSGGIFNNTLKGISQAQGNADMAAIMASLKARGIEVFPVSAADLPARYHQPDGVHLTPAGHKLVATQLLPQIVAALGPPTRSDKAAAPQSVVNACMADARRLCPTVLGDAASRHACMHEHRSELSEDCLHAIARSEHHQ